MLEMGLNLNILQLFFLVYKTCVNLRSFIFCTFQMLYTFNKKEIKEGSELYRGSYMSAHVLLILLNELGKRDKMRGLPSILSLFRNEFNKFNKT